MDDPFDHIGEDCNDITRSEDLRQRNLDLIAAMGTSPIRDLVIGRNQLLGVGRQPEPGQAKDPVLQETRETFEG